MNLTYLVREPKIKQEKNPLLLLLHGYGSNEEDLFSFAPQLPEDVYVISIRAPFNLQPYGYAWYEITFDADENKFSNNEQAKESLQLIANFIDEISEKLEANYSLTTASCTASLHMALIVLGIKPGDEVLVPSLTFSATANAIKYIGAKPVFCDITSLSNLTIDPDEIKKKITKNTKYQILVMVKNKDLKKNLI